MRQLDSQYTGKFKGTLIDGDEVMFPMSGSEAPYVVWVEPVAGDTVNVWFSKDGGTTYYEWPNGAVTSASLAEDKYTTVLSKITNMKVQRTVGSGVASTYGVC